MRLRILTWNIKEFSDSNVRTSRILDQIERVVRPNAQLEADLFVVLEVVSGSGPVGEPVTEKGGRGIRRLASRFRRDLSDDWRLVPPLRLSKSTRSPGGKTSRSEGIGVLYRSSKVRFTGPNQYDYAGTGFEGLDDPAVTNGLAGQCEFEDGYGQSIGFPYQRNRRPWLTTFRTKTGGVSLKLLSFHAPPEQTRQEKGKKVPKRSPEDRECFRGTQALASIQEITGSEAVIVTGDFNCNYADPQFREAYSGLKAQGFTPQNTTTATTLKTPSTARIHDYKTGNVFDNVLLRNVSLASGQPSHPNVAVVDPVRGRPEGYPAIYALDGGGYTPSTIHTNTFRSGSNFGLLTKTSDHLPVYVDVDL